MKLLHISLMNSCNRACYYCPMRKWLRPLEDAQKKGMNLLTNAALLKWLSAFIRPNDWIIELTGGEPGLYPEIQTLIPALTDRGYHGLIKTNGSLPIPKSKAFQRIAAWHEGVEKIPPYHDQILIINNPHDDQQIKTTYCKQHNVPYQVVLFDRKFEGIQTDYAQYDEHGITTLTHINSSGDIAECPAQPPVQGRNIFNMSPPSMFDKLTSSCRRCKIINDDVRFLPDDLKNRIQREYEIHVKRYTNLEEFDRRFAEYNTAESKARAIVDETYAAQRKKEIALLLAVRRQPGWPVDAVWS